MPDLKPKIQYPLWDEDMKVYSTAFRRNQQYLSVINTSTKGDINIFTAVFVIRENKYNTGRDTNTGEQ